MPLSKEAIEKLQQAYADNAEATYESILASARENALQYGIIYDELTDTTYALANTPGADLYEYKGMADQIIHGISDIPEASLIEWDGEINLNVAGFSIPGLAQLIGSLSGIGEAILAPVMVAFEALSNTIETINEFISNLASDIASGMEDALGVIGTIVIDPLLGILSAFGDYLGEKASAFIENAIGEQ